MTEQTEPARIETSNPHEVRKWIEGRIKAGVLRNCVNLQMIRIGDQLGSIYSPKCNCDSFHWKLEGPAPPDIRFMYLQSNMHSTDPISCPKDCSFYKNRSWSQKKARFRAFGSYVVLPFEWAGTWYSNLKWPQIALIGAIVFLLILWRAPHWVPPILDLIRAVTRR